MNEPTYSSSELMIVNAARLLKNGDVVFVGVGQPNLAQTPAALHRRPNPGQRGIVRGQHVRYFCQLPAAG